MADPHPAALMFVAQRYVEKEVLTHLWECGYDDITLAQGRIAARLGERGSRLTELAEAAQVTKQTAGYLVDQLERAGYVERRPNPDDRRGALVVLCPDTPRDEVLPAVFGPLGEDMVELAGRFTPDQLAAIAEYLGETTEILRRHTARVSSSPRSRGARAS